MSNICEMRTFFWESQTFMKKGTNLKTRTIFEIVNNFLKMQIFFMSRNKYYNANMCKNPIRCPGSSAPGQKKKSKQILKLQKKLDDR